LAGLKPISITLCIFAYPYPMLCECLWCAFATSFSPFAVALVCCCVSFDEFIIYPRCSDVYWQISQCL